MAALAQSDLGVGTLQVNACNLGGYWTHIGPGVTFRHKGAGYFRHIGASRSGQKRASIWVQEWVV